MASTAATPGPLPLARVSPAARELSAAHRREEDTIVAWLSSQPGVDARRTSSYAPEQWEGTVDGHAFYFRERGGL
jgi:hypothetical protein